MDEPYESCEKHECYVCYEPCETPTACKCKTLFVHSSCIAIMQIYGKEECGICKDPYPRVEQPLELFEDDDTEEELPFPPCCCYFFPTAIRPDYHISTLDRCFDLLRISISVSIIFVVSYSLSHLMHQFDIFTPFTFTFLIIMCCCLCAEHRQRRLLRNLDLQIHRETVYV